VLHGPEIDLAISLFQESHGFVHPALSYDGDFKHAQFHDIILPIVEKGRGEPEVIILFQKPGDPVKLGALIDRTAKEKDLLFQNSCR
jgi:hypothetical protein